MKLDRFLNIRTEYNIIISLLILSIILIIIQYTSNSQNPETVLRSRRNVNDYKYSSDLDKLDGISARVGEVEFYRLTLLEEPVGKNEGDGKISLKSQKPNKRHHIQFVRGDKGAELISESDEAGIVKKKSYPEPLMQKIRENESKQYYLNIIQQAQLEMEGKDLIWWGYNKTHEFLIDRKSLDNLDINNIKITDNLEQIYGKPKPTSNPPQKLPTSNGDKFSSWLMNPASKMDKSNQPRGLILLSPYAGEMPSIDNIFNHHDDVYYQYEPLKIVGEGCSSNGITEKVNFLTEVLNCQFKNLKPRIDALKKHDSISSRFVGKGGVVFRYKTQRLCKDNFCANQDYSKSEENCINKCPDINLKEASKLCKTKLPVTKVIRLCNLNSLEPIISEDFKAILFLKDPRDVAENRAKLFKDWSTDQIINSIKWTCLDTFKSLKSILVESKPWTKNKFLLIRAEDVQSDRQRWIENIMAFSGLDKDSKGMNDYIRDAEDKFDHDMNKIENWRNSTKLTISAIKQIETVCSNMMSLTGYLPSDENLIKNLSHKFYTTS